MGKSKLNNKGYVLVEIILASALAFGLAYFLIDLTIKLKNSNDDLLVKTLVSTDQAIITNMIMDKLEENAGDFECSDIELNNNVFKFNGKTNIISNYAVASYNSVTDCKIDSVTNTITINIPITVKQLPDEYFNVIIRKIKRS